MKTDPKQIDNGGPAFPHDGGLGNEGMSLRDYFAITLASGMAQMPGEGCSGYMEQRARVAYAFADAMLLARTPADPSGD